jgi:hypothetical protein
VVQIKVLGKIAFFYIGIELDLQKKKHFRCLGPEGEEGGGYWLQTLVHGDNIG